MCGGQSSGRPLPELAATRAGVGHRLVSRLRARASLPAASKVFRLLGPPGPTQEEGAGGGQTPAACVPLPVPHFLTRIARKTGKRRIHQKPMLSLLVQHLQGGAGSGPASTPSPQPWGV